MDPVLRHLPHCIECKRSLIDLEAVTLFPCHFCVVCLPCVHYFLAIRQTRKCGVCREEVKLRDLVVDDKLTTLSALLRYAPQLNETSRHQWLTHYVEVLQQYANQRFPTRCHRFMASTDLPDFSERAAIDLEKQPEMTESGWICESCGATSPFKAWRCVECECINFAWHSLVLGVSPALPGELSEVLRFREVKTISSLK